MKELWSKVGRGYFLEVIDAYKRDKTLVGDKDMPPSLNIDDILLRSDFELDRLDEFIADLQETREVLSQEVMRWNREQALEALEKIMNEPLLLCDFCLRTEIDNIISRPMFDKSPTPPLVPIRLIEETGLWVCEDCEKEGAFNE